MPIQREIPIQSLLTCLFLKALPVPQFSVSAVLSNFNPLFPFLIFTEC